MSDDYEITVLCEVLKVSRSGYYQWRQAGVSARARRSEAITHQIEAVHAVSRCTYGSPRVTAALRAQGESVGRNRVARLMRAAGLQGRQRRRYRVRTTDSRHDQSIAPNHLVPTPPPTKPDAVWVTDITYVETAEGWLYLAGVLDLYSRRLIGWAMGSGLASEGEASRLQADLSSRSITQHVNWVATISPSAGLAAIEQGSKF